MNAFAVAHNHLGQFEADVIQRGLENRANLLRIARTLASFWFPASPFASTSTVSFVLMSPSTVMRLKLLRDGFLQRRLQNLRVNRRVGRDEAQHRRVQSSHGGNAAGRAPVADIPG